MSQPSTTTTSTARRTTGWVTRGLAGMALAATITGIGAGVASAAEPPAPQQPAAAVVTATPAQAKGISAITMVITNNTDQQLTLESSSYGHGHWQQRPTDLAPSASETISGYSDNVGGSSMYVLYDLPNGQGVQFSVSVPTDGGDQGFAQSTDPAYITTMGSISGFHPTVAAAVSPAS